MAAYTWGHIIELLVIIAWFMTMSLMLVSVANIDYAPYKLRCNKLYTDDAARTTCEANAALGHVGCVDKFIDNNTWTKLPWWVFYMTPVWMVLMTTAFAIYLAEERYAIMWFVLAAGVVLSVIVLVFSTVTTSIWWAQCKDWDFCTIARYSNDFTDYVNASINPWYIIFCVTLWAGLLILVGLIVVSIWTQICVSRAVAESPGTERSDLLNPDLSPSDARKLRTANADSPLGIMTAPDWKTQ